MAVPPLTREGVRPYFPERINDLLGMHYNDGHIPQFFSDQGVLTKGTDGIFRIQMYWCHNRSNEITGIFIRVIFQKGGMVVWIRKEACEGLSQTVWIQNSEMVFVPKGMRTDGIPKAIMDALRGESSPAEKVPELGVQNIRNYEMIIDFFKGHEDVLPKSFRDQAFPTIDPIEGV
ncbi:MAG: hypothetical protein KDK76_06050 [Chlamydiia bacterium]|nr:hypothetical protein [Chlamydiia bacterium]